MFIVGLFTIVFYVVLLLFTRSYDKETQKTSYYISCPRRMVYHLTLTVKSGHSWIYAPPHDIEVAKATSSSELYLVTVI